MQRASYGQSPPLHHPVPQHVSTVPQLRSPPPPPGSAQSHQQGYGGTPYQQQGGSAGNVFGAYGQFMNDPTAQVAALTTAGITALTPADVAVLKADQVAALTTTQVSDLTTARVSTLTTAQIGQGLTTAQVVALTHGISRALLHVNPDNRLPLKKSGLLTRDPRMKERKKYGQKGARAKFQFSKR